MIPSCLKVDSPIAIRAADGVGGEEVALCLKHLVAVGPERDERGVLATDCNDKKTREQQHKSSEYTCDTQKEDIPLSQVFYNLKGK